MAAISFKSVGETTEDRVRRRAIEDAERLPLGIMTPVRAGDETDGIFKMHHSISDLIHDNFKNLLITNHGDRVIMYDYGANLQPLTFEITNSENFNIEAMRRIKTAVERYMPFIVLDDFETNVGTRGQQSTGRVDISITYDVPRANIAKKKITVTFFVGG